MYIDHLLPVAEKRIVLLKGLEGNNLLSGKTNARQQKGINFSQNSNGLLDDDETRQKFKHIYAVLPDEFKFSTFVGLVMNDEINVDEFPELKKHYETHSQTYREWAALEKAYNKLRNEPADEERERKQTKIVDIRRANHNILMLKAVLKGDNLKNAKDMFHYLFANDMITNIKLDEAKLKEHVIIYDPKISDQSKNAVMESYSDFTPDAGNKQHYSRLTTYFEESYDEHRARMTEEKKAAKKKPPKDDSLDSTENGKGRKQPGRRKKTALETTGLTIQRAASDDSEDAPNNTYAIDMETHSVPDSPVAMDLDSPARDGIMKTVQEHLSKTAASEKKRKSTKQHESETAKRRRRLDAELKSVQKKLIEEQPEKPSDSAKNASDANATSTATEKDKAAKEASDTNVKPKDTQPPTSP